MNKEKRLLKKFSFFQKNIPVISKDKLLKYILATIFLFSTFAVFKSFFSYQYIISGIFYIIGIVLGVKASLEMRISVEGNPRGSNTPILCAIVAGIFLALPTLIAGN